MSKTCWCFLFRVILATAMALSGGLLLEPATAQSIFATIVGTVTDSTSAVIPGARIRAININTNEEREFSTNESGQYEISTLFPGVYVLEVSMDGFNTHRRERIELASKETARIDVALDVAAQVTEVLVTTDSGARIETESSKLTDVRDLRQIQSLPLGTRSMYRYLVLTPGVTGGMNGTMSVSGSRSRQVHYQVDGVTMSDVRSSNTIGPTLNFIEAFEEAKIDFGANSAEFKAIGTLTIASKRGGNQFHGAFYDYYNTGAFRAGDYFNHRKLGTPSHGFGMNLNGPVVVPGYRGRDKTFWFLSYETTYQPSAVENFNINVPLPAWKQGDFSGESATITDPLAGDSPFANNMIPAARISQAAKQYLPLWPDPNVGSPLVYANRNYQDQLPRDFSKPHNVQIRVDHRISSNNTLYGRFLHQYQRNPGFESGLPGTLGMRVQNRRVRHVLFNDTHTFSPTLLNEARFGISWNTNPRHAADIDGPAFLAATGLTNVTRDGNIPNIHQVPVLTFASGAALQTIEATRERDFNEDLTFQWQNTVTKIAGKHSLKLGFEVNKRHQNDQFQQADLFGSYRFSNRYTGFNFADFLLGTPDRISRSPFAEIVAMRQVSWEGFVQDDYKITNSLTLNLGFRYELGEAWTVNGDRLSAFDPASGSIVVPDSALPLVSDLFPTDQVAVIGHSQTGFSERLFNTDKNNFAPRVGFAWRPFGATFVIRGGYGIFYNVIPFRPDIFGTPFIVREPVYFNPRDVSNPGFVQWPLAFPLAGSGGAGVSVPGLWQTDLQTPYAQNWNLTVEKELPWALKVRASYVGTGGRQMAFPFNINQPAPGPGLYVNKPRPYPTLPAINEQRNGASHTYNAFNLEFERRFANGLMFQTSFTHAKDIGDEDVTPENTFDRARERAQTLVTPINRWVGFFIYELPFGRGKPMASGASGILQGLLGGWELSASAAAQDGRNETATWLAPDIHGITHTTSSSAPNVARRPDCLSDPNLPDSQRSPDRWFDTSGFALPTTPGVFGSCGRAIIEGPGVAVLHTGLFKRFTVRERYSFRVGLQGTNILNHPNFSNLSNLRLDRSNAGVITSANGATSSSAGDAPRQRELRLDLRVEF